MKLKSPENKTTRSPKTDKAATKHSGTLKVRSKLKSGGNIMSLGKH